MNVIVILVIYAVLLFLLAFFSKRRFGVLGLALAAGYVLQRLWESEFPAWAANLSFLGDWVISPLTVVSLLVLLTPSLLLIFGGPVYKGLLGRILGSLLYSLLAVLFGIGALSGLMDLSGSSRQFFDVVMLNRDYILTGALIVAVIDVMHSRLSGFGSIKKK
ncbi:hypothetical protein GX865_02995 [Candidatus Saccharibacteria bacterium]|jgi:hypothetical protein|nr:hypothetical protein [Candidatus Saccharibacteria bacterium]